MYDIISILQTNIFKKKLSKNNYVEQRVKEVRNIQ